MVIREMDVGDVENVINILNKNYNEVMHNYHSKEVIEEFKLYNSSASWHNQLRWKNIFVVEENGALVATGAIANFGSLKTPRYAISNFFVLPEMHRMGVGTLLFKYIFEFAKCKGIKSLHVPSSRTGIEFYKKIGFKIDEVQDDIKNEITWMSMPIV
jgi:GNAT superfamily N-acetyltransferase